VYQCVSKIPNVTTTAHMAWDAKVRAADAPATTLFAIDAR